MRNNVVKENFLGNFFVVRIFS